MEFSTDFALILDRLQGPLSFRFILQPLLAMALGIRDGRRDARSGLPPYLFDVLFDGKNRLSRLKASAPSLLLPFALAIVLDIVVQFMVFDRFFVGQGIVVGLFVIALPYAICRGLANRLSVRRQHAR
jgi:hypothetical protein